MVTLARLGIYKLGTHTTTAVFAVALAIFGVGNGMLLIGVNVAI
jgi:hypothetical protein